MTIKVQEKPVFLISIGRSGSTWLQKIINTHPDIVMWGEHAGFISDLASSYYKVVNRNQIVDSNKENKEKILLLNKTYNIDFNPVWSSPITKESILYTYKTMLLELFTNDINNNMRWGFKEIRYCDFDVLRFLYELFPYAQFIFLERDVVNICKSQVLSFYGEVNNKLNNTERQILIYELTNKIQTMKDEVKKFKKEIEDNLQNNCYIEISYDNLVDNYDYEVKQIFNFLRLDICSIIDKLGIIKRKKIHPTIKDNKLLNLIEMVIDNKNNFIKNDNFNSICNKKQIKVIDELKM